mgnify:CR=1 FL=1
MKENQDCLHKATEMHRLRWRREAILRYHNEDCQHKSKNRANSAKCGRCHQRQLKEQLGGLRWFTHIN